MNTSSSSNTFHVVGMTCADCVNAVAAAVDEAGNEVVS